MRQAVQNGDWQAGRLRNFSANLEAIEEITSVPLDLIVNSNTLLAPHRIEGWND